MSFERFGSSLLVFLGCCVGGFALCIVAAFAMLLLDLPERREFHRGIDDRKAAVIEKAVDKWDGKATFVPFGFAVPVKGN